MKYSFATALLAGLAAASPVEKGLAKRQFGMTQNDLDQGGACKDIIFIFARGSTEPGNMGISFGPPTCSGLKREYGDDRVMCQGVGGAYKARLMTNALLRGTTDDSIQEAMNQFQTAATRCPSSVIVAGGYSQGAAVMNGAVQDLDATIQSKIAGVILYGSTRNLQTGGHIPNFPDEKSKTICAMTDGVCYGVLLVTPGHLTYLDDVPGAVRWLSDRISAQSTLGAGMATDAELQEIAQTEGGVPTLQPGTSLGGF